MAPSPNGDSPSDQANTPRRSVGLIAAAQLASATVNAALPKKPQPDVDQLMAEYAAQSNNNPEALVRANPSVRGRQCARPGMRARASWQRRAHAASAGRVRAPAISASLLLGGKAAQRSGCHSSA
jgi:hypothetical protein